ncbi:hypothetical protein H6F76_23835 [Leptolyngbya sp. FACHB-321]|uniref:hypothetical protein n=1 Tax=Leptolyngbya sp. FACHB-321 TaxID=2692807 RepID=UPI001685334F|nr:hypothetical protein [Leptolyngbya sp. FACHB-321]MBD2037985.1 hypothetical protein [Leptolyngbya sp. FACHB-321]
MLWRFFQQAAISIIGAIALVEALHTVFPFTHALFLLAAPSCLTTGALLRVNVLVCDRLW